MDSPKNAARWQVWHRPRGSYQPWQKLQGVVATRTEAFGLISAFELTNVTCTQQEFVVLPAEQTPATSRQSYRQRMLRAT